MCFHIVCGCLGALIAELNSCDRGHMACKDEDTLWPVQKKCTNSCKIPRVYGRKNGTWEAAPRQAYQEDEASPRGDGGGRGESRCHRKLEIWSQADSESTRLLQRAGGGLRGPGRTAKGVQKSCREKNRTPTPTPGGLLQLLLTPQPECTQAGMEGGHSVEPRNQMGPVMPRRPYPGKRIPHYRAEKWAPVQAEPTDCEEVEMPMSQPHQTGCVTLSQLPSLSEPCHPSQAFLRITCPGLYS